MLETIKVQGGWIFMVILENRSDFYSGLSMEGLEAAPDPPFGSIGTVGTAAIHSFSRDVYFQSW